MRRPIVLIPLLGLLLILIVVTVLVGTGRIDLPFGGSQAGMAEASEGDDSEKKNGKDDDDEEEILPVPVELAFAGPRRISAYYRASSVVEADRHVDLVSRTQGRARKVNVDEGDWVHAGQVLAELENDRERIGLRSGELRAADQRRELDRVENLLEQELVTQDQHEDTKSAWQLAVAEKDLAAIRLDETIIRAPFDGQITDRKIVPGQHIQMYQPLFTLVDFEPLRVRVHLPEVIARKVSAGDQVHLDVEALPEPVAATVERVSPVVDPETSTVRLTLLVEGDVTALRVGGFVKVRVTTDTQLEALSIPKIALVEEGGLRSVFVAEADSVRKIEIRTGLYDESHIEVLEGIEEGAWVVELGQGGLRTGSKVEVLNAAEVGWVAPEPEGEEGAGEEGEEVAEEDDDEDTSSAEGDGAAVALNESGTG